MRNTSSLFRMVMDGRSCLRRGLSWVAKLKHQKAYNDTKREWNGLIYAKRGDEEFLFSDVKAKPDVKKECVPVAQQADNESRRLWRHVTAALFHDKINIASSAKRWIEQRQRDEVKRRLESKETWASQLFDKNQEAWVYKNSLDHRS
uniref:Uncharacterized protein n=1 Tax=Ditylenchus dipsaci TaxID=166011 RepID=A0A915EPG3_9BILA